jgi:hypothetical protein
MDSHFEQLWQLLELGGLKVELGGLELHTNHLVAGVRASDSQAGGDNDPRGSDDGRLDTTQPGGLGGLGDHEGLVLGHK